MAALYLDLDGELVVIDHGSRAALVARLGEVDEAADLAARLAGGDQVVDVALDERALLASVVGRWHAEDGVLPSDLSDLRDAAAAAVVRRDVARR